MDGMKAVLLAAVISAAWCFNGWLGYLSINTKEQTQRVMSLDRKAVEMARMRKCLMDIELKKFDDQEGK